MTIAPQTPTTISGHTRRSADRVRTVDISSPSRSALRAGGHLPSSISGSTIQIVDPLRDPEWDSRILSLPSYSFFHTSYWARVLHDTYGYTPVYFALFDAEGLRSVLPIMEVNSRLTGKRGGSLPFTDDCEPTQVDPKEFQSLYEAAREYGKKQNWKTLECRGGVTSIPDATPSTSFHGHRLDLTKSHCELFADFAPATRRAIRKAERSDLTIEKSATLESLLAYYDLHCATRKRHGLPPQPRKMFENIHRDILASGHGTVVLARHGDTPVAGALFVHFGTHAIFKFGASKVEELTSRPNNLVMWEAIKHLSEKGLTTLHLGRTSLKNKGLRHFKQSWGTSEYLIDYLKYDLRRQRYLTARDRSEGWHNPLFRLLPIPLARLVGSLLYRHVA